MTDTERSLIEQALSQGWKYGYREDCVFWQMKSLVPVIEDILDGRAHTDGRFTGRHGTIGPPCPDQL